MGEPTPPDNKLDGACARKRQMGPPLPRAGLVSGPVGPKICKAGRPGSGRGDRPIFPFLARFSFLSSTAGANLQVSRRFRRVPLDLRFETQIDPPQGRTNGFDLNFRPPQDRGKGFDPVWHAL